MTDETTALLEKNRELEQEIAHLQRQLAEKQDEVNLLWQQLTAALGLRDE